MRESACRWLIVKKAKIFEVMLKIFEFSRVRENDWSLQKSFFELANHIFRVT